MYTKELEAVRDMIPARPLVIRIEGSQVYGLATEESDIDFMAVFAAPTLELLSVEGFRIDGKRTESWTHSKPDIRAWEVRHFCELLLKGNPGVIESLYSPPGTYLHTHEWNDLCLYRRAFLSKAVVRQYLGYISGQLSRLHNGQSVHTTGGSYNTKFAYHCLRLCHDGLVIAQGGEPQVRKEGPFKRFLLDVRNDAYRKEIVEDMIHERIGHLEHALAHCSLPEEGDRALLNEWLLNIRTEGLVRWCLDE